MKPIYASKTFWFNILFLIIALAEHFGFANFSPNPDTVALAAGIVALVNIGLRLYTDKAIKLP